MAGASRTRFDFGPLAASYDSFRPVDENWRRVYALLEEVGDFTGRKVLDVGCGTGRLVAALADGGARVWGVDASPEMVEEARRTVGSRGGVRVGVAEELPFKDGWFERAVMRLVAHHVDRPRSFREIRRVLAPGGRFVIATFDANRFGEFWLTPYFPSIPIIDAERFPTAEMLEDELQTAGFRPCEVRRLTQRDTVSRADGLAKIRGRYISTLALVDEPEFAAGLARAERELPDTTQTELHWLVVAAER